MNIIQTPDMPVSKGHYSQCIEHNNTLYISGQLPVTPDGKIPDSIADQTLLVLQKIDKILFEAGSSKERIIQVRIYLADINLWEQVNEVYASFMGNYKPVRCVIPTGPLHHGCLIEAEVIAAKNV
jgi:2-iminobutanoate/2-iminopropanoate deaminase